MKITIVILILILLSGCSLASHTVRDVDKHILEMKNTMSVECIAGFYSGIAFGTDNPKISKAVTELENLADREKLEYKKCRAKGLEVSILSISGKENLDEAIHKFMSFGLF